MEDYIINGFYPFGVTQELSLESVYQNQKDLFFHSYIPFTDDPGGWQFIISLKEPDYGKVYFCEMDLELPESLTLLANNFEEFINGLEKPPYE